MEKYHFFKKHVPEVFPVIRSGLKIIQLFLGLIERIKKLDKKF